MRERYLTGPVFEVLPESRFYIYKNSWRKANEEARDTLKKVTELVGDTGFSFNGKSFGFSRKFVETGKLPREFASDVSKNHSKGIYKIKKRSELYNKILPLSEEIDTIIEKTVVGTGFIAFDVFGLNNLSSTQWIDDRLFASVYSEVLIERQEDLKLIDYPEYTALVAEWYRRKNNESKLFLANRETGARIEQVEDIESGLELIKKHEEDDKKNDCYKENYYDIVNENYESQL